MEANIALRSSKIGFYAKINGYVSRNRGVDGDLVAVRVLTKEEQSENEAKEKRWMMDNPKAASSKMWDQFVRIIPFWTWTVPMQRLRRAKIA